MTWLHYLVTLHAGKDAAYGDAWCRRGESAGIFPNIARKYDRWQRIREELGSAGSNKPADERYVVEPLDDTLADLCIYAVKYLVWLRVRHPGLTLPNDAPQSMDSLGTVDAGLSLAGLHANSAATQARDATQVLRLAFHNLEQTFLEPQRLTDITEVAGRRISASWDLAWSSFALLQQLPFPEGHQSSADRHATGPAVAGLNPPSMTDVASDLLGQLLPKVTRDPGRVLLVGYTPEALQLAAALRDLDIDRNLIAISDPELPAQSPSGVLPWSDVGNFDPRHVVICNDPHKESLLRAYLLVRNPDAPLPTVVLSGIGHLTYGDDGYLESDAPALVPSYATGYPYTRIHMFQHLRAAARVGLRGAIVEFGAFKGGTTAWLARTARQLGLEVPVLAFDSWDGFPPRRSLLDLYEHPRCVFRDLPAVRSYLEPLRVQLIEGDISETAARLVDTPILLGFIDTDNYSPAHAALTAIADNVIPGGAIVFDHYTTTLDYLYTLGERMAGQDVLRDRNFLHVHGSGVFLRLPEPDIR